MMEPRMTKEKKDPQKRRRNAPEPNPVDAVMDELVERHPHLRRARETMWKEGIVGNQFSQDALSAFRQRFGV